jgi:hypothetical protein
MLFDVNRVRANARQATTEDLLDRVTVFRADMESAAVAVIEEELRRRGVTPEQVQAHGERAAHQAIRLADGSVARCELCDRPAVMEQEGWQRLLSLVPLYWRTFYYCAQHRPAARRR